jgi:hypothetical protein
MFNPYSRIASLATDFLLFLRGVKVVMVEIGDQYVLPNIVH